MAEEGVVSNYSKIQIGLAISIAVGLLSLQGMIFHQQLGTSADLAQARLDSTKEFAELDKKTALIESRQETIIKTLDGLSFPWERDAPSIIKRLSSLESRLLELERLQK